MGQHAETKHHSIIGNITAKLQSGLIVVYIYKYKVVKIIRQSSFSTSELEPTDSSKGRGLPQLCRKKILPEFLIYEN